MARTCDPPGPRDQTPALYWASSLSQLEEIDLSGQEPRDDLVAALVAGRDFVSERLEERLGVIDADRRFFREYISRRAEAVDEHEQMAFDTQLAQFREQRQQIGRELQLRATFLDGKLDAEAVVAPCICAVGDVTKPITLPPRAARRYCARSYPRRPGRE